MKNVNSLNELIKKFEDIAVEESNLIKNYSIVALKHVGTGKYLSSAENFNYTTGSCTQLVFAGSPVPDSNSLWKIKFVKCNNTYNFRYQQYWNENWKFNDSKLENRQGYLKSNDNINLSIKKSYDDNKVEFLRSHDIQFTIGNDTFQEVVCHNERLGGNDEWCIELIKQNVWTIDTLHD
ncbi:unnamed protein product [Rhizophagus irregularis]|nr:unnamed protein product [Rhizophagus irregularis]